MGIRIYLDTCCVHRPFDDQAAERVHRETEAVLGIVIRCESGELAWIGSDILRYEAARVRNQNIREGSELLYQAVHEWVPLTDGIRARATELETLGFRPLDALHLASAEAGTVQVFLTVDDQLLRTGTKVSKAIGVRVLDPITWSQQEVER